VTGRRADSRDVSAGGAKSGQVFGAQLAGEGDLEPGVVRLGYQLRERIVREP
jgi:hypothetical protein